MLRQGDVLAHRRGDLVSDFRLHLFLSTASVRKDKPHVYRDQNHHDTDKHLGRHDAVMAVDGNFDVLLNVEVKAELRLGPQ